MVGPCLTSVMISILLLTGAAANGHRRPNNGWSVPTKQPKIQCGSNMQFPATEMRPQQGGNIQFFATPGLGRQPQQGAKGQMSPAPNVQTSPASPQQQSAPSNEVYVAVRPGLYQLDYVSLTRLEQSNAMKPRSMAMQQQSIQGRRDLVGKDAASRTKEMENVDNNV